MAITTYVLAFRVEVADSAVRDMLAAKVKTFIANEKATNGLVLLSGSLNKEEYSKPNNTTETV